MPTSNTRWIIDTLPSSGTSFTPLWPGEFVDEYLIRGTPRMVLTSATLSPNHAKYLGLKSWDYLEAGDGFDPKRRPFYYYPSGVRIRAKKLPGGRWGYDERELRIAMTKYDAFMKLFLDSGHKGIVQVTSYDMAEKVYRMSENRSRLLKHGSHNTEEVIKQYLRSTEPVGLISPAIPEGRDFPYDLARWTAMFKIPMPPPSNLMKARNAKDETNGAYRDMVACDSLIQRCGRPMRAPDDWCVTMISDNQMDWWWPKQVANGNVSNWFKRGYRRVNRLPQPLEV